MQLQECTDYKEALKLLTEERKLGRKSVTYEAMAKHCRIQKTYLSKVLNKEGNLSIDQIFLASEYLKLSPLESQFLENLYFLNTTTLPLRKQKYMKALEKNRQEILKSENSIKTENETLHNLSIEKYYLDPYYQLIHIFLTIEMYSRNHHRIANQLGISVDKFETYIDDLRKWKMIEYKKGTYQVIKNNLHLPKNSSLIGPFRNSARFASQNKMNQLNEEDFYSFSAIISCDILTQKRIQKRFLDFLKQCQLEVMESEPKEVYQINFDLLKWS